MSAPSTIGDASHADKIAEIHRLRDLNAKLQAALESLCDAVGGMRVPQTVEDAGLQVFVTIGPAFERARDAIAAAKGETFTTGQARQGVAP